MQQHKVIDLQRKEKAADLVNDETVRSIKHAEKRIPRRLPVSPCVITEDLHSGLVFLHDNNGVNLHKDPHINMVRIINLHDVNSNDILKFNDKGRSTIAAACTAEHTLHCINIWSACKCISLKQTLKFVPGLHKRLGSCNKMPQYEIVAFMCSNS